MVMDRKLVGVVDKEEVDKGPLSRATRDSCPLSFYIELNNKRIHSYLD